MALWIATIFEILKHHIHHEFLYPPYNKDALNAFSTMHATVNANCIGDIFYLCMCEMHYTVSLLENKGYIESTSMDSIMHALSHTYTYTHTLKKKHL